MFATRKSAGSNPRRITTTIYVSLACEYFSFGALAITHYFLGFLYRFFSIKAMLAVAIVAIATMIAIE